MKFKAVTGTQDFTPDRSVKFDYIVSEIKRVADIFNYQEVHTPIFEYTELFARSIGKETDIVSKEMYTFEDSGENLLTLRPENTASIVRMAMEHHLCRENPQLKIFYFGPMFRRERPQKGRYRQFHQFGIEAIGPKSPELDAEVILFAWATFSRFGLKKLKLKINSIGTPDTRETYIKSLKDYIRPKLDTYCNDCKKRFEKNTLRILDCKKDADKNEAAPKIIDYLSGQSREHFDRLKKILSKNKISYEVDTKLVRGLDYYTDTVFEILSEDLGAQSAICGGGRYDLLFKEFGGEETAAVGFAGGFERLMLILEENNFNFPKRKPKIFIVTLDDNARLAASEILYQLRLSNIPAETDYLYRSVKAQMKYANKINADYTVVIGEDELFSGKVNLKRMSDGETRSIDLDQLLNFLKNE